MTPAAPLTNHQVVEQLARLAGWTGSTAGLERTYVFDGFPTAIAFMQACVAAIDRLNHHPEWTNVYNRVSIRLRTHDAGDRVTTLDVELAFLLERQATQHQAR